MSYRLSIIEDIRNTKSRNEGNQVSINFQKIISKQQEMIRSLQQQILLLKSYLTLGRVFLQTETVIHESEKELKEKMTENHPNVSFAKQYQALIKKIAEILQLKNEQNIDQKLIVAAVRSLKEAINKKNEPIFIERIKQIKMPITIEKIIQKPVQKIIEKIVYIEKPTVVFKQKIIQRFIERKQQPSDANYQKTLKMPKQEKERDSQKPRQYNKNYQNDNYSYRNQDFASNLIKRRDYPARNYVPKAGNNQKKYY